MKVEDKNIENNESMQENIEEEVVQETLEEEAEAEVEALVQAEQEKESKKEADDTKEEKKSFFKKKGKSAKTLEIELKKAKDETAEYKDKYQRLMAEFENARKRTAKETSKMYDMGAKDVLEKLLPIIDSFERGLAVVSGDEKDSPFVQGMDKIYKQLMSACESLGVKAMNAEGTEFNPDFHNAVMHVEDENLGENVVAQELQKGYMYKDTVLRYSMVKVAN